MLQEIIGYMSQVDPLVVYLILIFFAFIENVFPPSPSDVVVIIGASFIAARGSADFIALIVLTSFSSSFGFMLMYWVGKKFGQRLVRSHKIKFITEEDLVKADFWFARYGYVLILINRFLPGTRSAISFFTGVHELNFTKTFVFATISAFLWNVVIIWLGFKLGENVALIDYYLKTYSSTVILATIIIVAFFVIKKVLAKRKKFENKI